MAKKKQFKVRVEWRQYAKIEVNATSNEEAIEKARKWFDKNWANLVPKEELAFITDDGVTIEIEED